LATRAGGSADAASQRRARRSTRGRRDRDLHRLPEPAASRVRRFSVDHAGGVSVSPARRSTRCPDRVWSGGDRGRDRKRTVRHRVALARGKIEVELGPQALPVLGDASQMGRILDNLINNGLSYTSKAPHLLVTTSGEGGRVVLRVSDNGVGIASGDRERLFE